MPLDGYSVIYSFTLQPHLLCVAMAWPCLVSYRHCATCCTCICLCCGCKSALVFILRLPFRLWFGLSLVFRFRLYLCSALQNAQGKRCLAVKNNIQARMRYAYIAAVYFEKKSWVYCLDFFILKYLVEIKYMYISLRNLNQAKICHFYNPCVLVIYENIFSSSSPLQHQHRCRRRHLCLVPACGQFIHWNSAAQLCWNSVADSWSVWVVACCVYYFIYNG